jgi:hypothetical protein
VSLDEIFMSRSGPFEAWSRTRTLTKAGFFSASVSEYSRENNGAQYRRIKENIKCFMIAVFADIMLCD